jgi:hypothetical protein
MSCFPLESPHETPLHAVGCPHMQYLFALTICCHLPFFIAVRYPVILSRVLLDSKLSRCFEMLSARVPSLHRLAAATTHCKGSTAVLACLLLRSWGELPPPVSHS